VACLLHSSSAADALPFAEPGVRPSYAPDRTVRLEHVALSLHLDPATATFRGEATLRFRPFPAYDGTASFDLDEVEVTGVADGAGGALPFEHGDGVLRVRAGEAHAITVSWSGRAPRRGLYFTGPTEAEPHRPPSAWTQCQDEDAHYVVPCHDHPSVKHPWTITLTAPAGYTLLSNGRQVSSGERGGEAVATFEQAEPMPAYLLTMVAAKLDVVAEEWRGRPVRYFVPTGRAAEVPLAFDRTRKMLDFLSDRTGVDYPWPRYDQVVVHDFVFGGMENVACTTMTDLLLVDEKARLEWDPDGLVVHELAHQWFGDLLTCQDWSQGWLNESWATYAEALWSEHVDAPADAIWTRWETAQGYHAEAAGRYRRPIVSYDFREPIDLFDRHLYNKGGTVLGMLRHQLGDEAFFGGVRTYLRRHAHGTVHTRHFQRALEDASGRNLDQFFAQWIHAPGHPVAEVKLGRDGDALITIQVKQTQSGDGVPEVFRFPLDLELLFEGGRTQRLTLDVHERERTFVVPVASAVTAVRVDPGYHLLAELTLKGPEAWLVALLRDECPVLALRAGRGLLADGSRRGRDAVAAAVAAHPFPFVRGTLAKELAPHLAPEEAVRFLADRLAAESEPRAQRLLATALGTFRVSAVGPAGADALVALLGRPLPTWQLEGAALAALGATRDPRAPAVLRSALGRDSWADHVRSRGVEGLAETEDPSVVDDLVACSRSRFSDRVRAAAATGLARLAEGREELRTKVVERLIELVREPGFRTQLAAIGALGKLRDERGLAVLSRVHRTAPDGRTRRTAYEAMASIRKGRGADEAVSRMQRRLDELSEENAKLRGRVDRLERH
jgi:aminopeptidase N